jgi:hypothetical protein
MMAPAVKRVYIPKAGSTEKRPIGIPAYEDKILRRAVQMALEPIYEGEFYDFSYGFRPGKAAHQALERLWKESMNIRGGYIIDMDISKYADRRSDDTIPHGNLLHEVLDDWFVKVVRPRLKGKAFMVRYADDAVIGCERAEDAERIMKVLALRFAKYGLTIHPEKTRLIDFSKPEDGAGKGKGSFTFLRFTRHWTKSKKGRWIAGRKTDKKQLRRSIQAITQWCRENRHKPVKEQHEKLTVKLRGHYAYYGITMNFKSLERFFLRIREIWFKWLNRQPDKRSLYWWQYLMYLKACPLPYPRIVHSYV